MANFTNHPKKQFCSKGHDTFICGRRGREESASGTCKICAGKAHERFNATSDGKKVRRKACWKRVGILTKEGKVFTTESYDNAYRLQDGKCKMCKRSSSLFERGLIVDHDHITGKFRGLLCDGCNVGLGHYERIKDQAKSYLGDPIES
jgi:hypothetical protein